MVAVESSSPEETERVAAGLAPHLRPGDLVTVAGELGAGKTTFVRGAARTLGVDQPISSPTYTIGNRYRADPDVSHLDLYRFESVTELDWADLEAYFDDAIVFLEWPERAGAYLPEPKAAVRLRLLGAEHRLIEVESFEKSLEIAVSALC
jgi:tRNA threonylcarbamoyladenosine biosynthesis protein TsaE